MAIANDWEHQAHDRGALDALEALRQQGNLLATTNYDGLLLGGSASLNSVTWQESDSILGAVRKRETNKVIFLHGYWRLPESVILDWKSYDQIARDAQYRDDLAAFWKTSIWVYVGCGISGLSDPDFGLLLERYGSRARGAAHWDFCLVRRDQREEFQAYFEQNQLNICAVSLGDDYDKLPGFLRSLLPAPTVLVHPPKEAIVSPLEECSSIPKPPTLYAEPDYIGSHQFVGRQAELDAISDWANRSDPTNLLLFEAIGGNGKSILTWEWTKNHATIVRPDWAGRFWYSFYERGAIMEDFCQRALAYMTGRPLKEFEKRKTAEMRHELIVQLHARPWLLILDGLERVLVAYHRIDAAEVPDEEANAPTDKVLNRNPCDAIRDEDNDLLRAIAACAPSKILVSSRLTPRVLLNPAGQPIPGARRITLPGLRPPDAEKLLRSCGITGDNAAIQDYLRQNCDNHPLVIGILAGLIANYLPDRGNFDAWSTDPGGGAALDLAKLDLIQRRNHILFAAIAALPDASRQLLSTLALLSESVDYKTLEAFNPHLPPTEVRIPTTPKEKPHWSRLSDEKKAKALERYEAALAQRKEYEETMRAWREPIAAAPKKLAETVHDLELRGLLQYDSQTKRYDIHPVVRSIAAGGLPEADQARYGLRLVDYFSQKARNPYNQAKTREDIQFGLHLVRSFVRVHRFGNAIKELRSGLLQALLYGIEDFSETLSLMLPLFKEGWDKAPSGVTGAWLSQQAAVALKNSGESTRSTEAYVASLTAALTLSKSILVRAGIAGIASNFIRQNHLSNAFGCYRLALEFAEAAWKTGDKEMILIARHNFFSLLSTTGQWTEAQAMLSLCESVSFVPKTPREASISIKIETDRARFHFSRGELAEHHLNEAEQRAISANNRIALRSLHRLRGFWRFEQHDYPKAAASFQEAGRMARERRLVDAASETGLALAKFHLGQLTGDDARNEAERLAQLREATHRYLAMLWLAIGDPEQAKKHALAAYRWAWADGEPYVHRNELTKTTELLVQMNVPNPTLPPYDPAKDEPFPWEADVRAAIEKLRAGE